MKLLEDRILKDGELLEGDILMVDSFLNHQVDINLLEEMSKDIYEHFEGEEITKVVTVEASGIAIGTMVAKVFNVPLIFAKKSIAQNLDENCNSVMIKSYTHKREYSVSISKKLISPEDKVLIIDDFLAEGNAIYGLIDLVNASGAEVVGIGVIVEKGFQSGGRNLRADGYNLYSLSIIEKFEDGNVIFR